MAHHDIEVPEGEKPEFDNGCVHHIQPLPGYGISP